MSWLDALLGRIRSAGVDLALGNGLNFLSPLTATRNDSTGFVDVAVDLPGGSTSIVVGADVQRAALTGAVEAAQNVNTTTFGAGAAGSSMAREDSNGALGYVGTTSTVSITGATGALGVIDIADLECGGCVSIDSTSGDYTIAGFSAKPVGFWFRLINRAASTTHVGTLIEGAGTTTTDFRQPHDRNVRFRRGESGVLSYLNDRWRVTWGRRPEDLDVLTQTTAQTVTNAITNLSAGSLSIPADAAIAGSEWQFEAMVHTSRGATATAANLVIELLVGGSAIRTLTLATTTTSGHLGYAMIRGRFSVRTAGGSGTAMVTLAATETVTTATATPATVDARIAHDPAPATSAAAATAYDTTAATTLELRARFSAAVANLSAHMYDCTIRRVK